MATLKKSALPAHLQSGLGGIGGNQGGDDPNDKRQLNPAKTCGAGSEPSFKRNLFLNTKGLPETDDSAADASMRPEFTNLDAENAGNNIPGTLVLPTLYLGTAVLRRPSLPAPPAPALTQTSTPESSEQARGRSRYDNPPPTLKLPKKPKK